MSINDQHSTVTLCCDKLHVVKEAIQSSNSVPLQNIKRLQHLFQGRNPILLLSIQSDVSLIEVFNNRN